MTIPGIRSINRTAKMRAVSIGLGVVSAVVLISGALLAGCGATHQSAADPTAANTHPGTREAVIQFPDGFRNVAFECFGTTGVYDTSRGPDTNEMSSSIAVLGNDPACK